MNALSSHLKKKVMTSNLNKIRYCLHIVCFPKYKEKQCPKTNVNASSSWFHTSIIQPLFHLKFIPSSCSAERLTCVKKYRIIIIQWLSEVSKKIHTTLWRKVSNQIQQTKNRLGKVCIVYIQYFLKVMKRLLHIIHKMLTAFNLAGAKVYSVFSSKQYLAAQAQQAGFQHARKDPELLRLLDILGLSPTCKNPKISKLSKSVSQ